MDEMSLLACNALLSKQRAKEAGLRDIALAGGSGLLGGAGAYMLSRLFGSSPPAQTATPLGGLPSYDDLAKQQALPTGIPTVRQRLQQGFGGKFRSGLSRIWQGLTRPFHTQAPQPLFDTHNLERPN